jgi:hypothetical protein
MEKLQINEDTPKGNLSIYILLANYKLGIFFTIAM